MKISNPEAANWDRYLLSTTPYTWIRDRIVSGWHSSACDNITVFQLLVHRDAQIEYVPIQVDGNECAAVHKVRYESVPHLPVPSNCMRVVNALFHKDRHGISPYAVPIQLLDAFKTTGNYYPPALDSDFWMESAVEACNFLSDSTSLACVLGSENIRFMGEQMAAFEANVAMSVKPIGKNKSIFSSDNRWTDWFKCLGWDCAGRVDAGRALASLDTTGFVGDVHDVPHWRTDPCVFKTRTRVTTIVEHQFIDFNDFKLWPENPCYYNPTPKMLEGYISIHGAAPKYLALAITSVISNAPQVKYFGEVCNHFSVSVKFAIPPLVIFERHEAAGRNTFPGDWAPKIVSKLEHAFLYGFLKGIKQVMRFEAPCTGCYFIKAEGATLRNLILNVMLDTEPNKYLCADYMSVKDTEIAAHVPAYSVGDVVIDGVRVAAPGAGRFYQDYPRVLPDYAPDYWVKVGDVLNDDVEVIKNTEVDVRPAMRDFGAGEVVRGAGGYKYRGVHARDAARPAPAPAPEPAAAPGAGFAHDGWRGDDPAPPPAAAPVPEVVPEYVPPAPFKVVVDPDGHAHVVVEPRVEVVDAGDFVFAHDADGDALRRAGEARWGVPDDAEDMEDGEADPIIEDAD